MARRSRESFQKRAREKARREKQAEKRAKRQSDTSNDEAITRSEGDSLMQEYATLSARYEANQVSTERYNKERQRIFVELGLESDD